MLKNNNFESILKDAGMRVTPQRTAVLEAVFTMNHHPSSDEIAGYVRKNHPHIAVGTVYNVLNSLVEAGLIHRVKTDKGVMLYDAEAEKHHHLYCSESDRIEDYYDPELDALLEEYFRKKGISGFEIEDIKLQLVGKFNKTHTSKI